MRWTGPEVLPSSSVSRKRCKSTFSHWYIIQEYFKMNHAMKYLLSFTTNKLPDRACLAYKLIYSQMKIHNQLNTSDALELRLLSQESKTRDEKNLCDEVTGALLEHIHAHLGIFLDLLDKRDFKKLLNNNLTVKIMAELVEARYARGNATKALIEFVWRWDELTEISCVGSLAFGAANATFWPPCITRSPLVVSPSE